MTKEEREELIEKSKAFIKNTEEFLKAKREFMAFCDNTNITESDVDNDGELNELNNRFMELHKDLTE